MSKSDDVYAISGRIKNSLAMKDLAITEVGTLLVNSYTMVLKDLHDLADKMPNEWHDLLKEKLFEKEDFIVNVVSLCTPRSRDGGLYERVCNAKARFDSNEAALASYTEEYEELGEKYLLTGDQFYEESMAKHPNEIGDHAACIKLRNNIERCKALINKEKYGR